MIRPLPPAALPPARVAAGWWSQLAGHSPHALVAGTIRVHRLEVLVEEHSPRPLDPLTRALLRALALVETPTHSRLNELLHLGEDRIASLLSKARRERLLDPPAGQNPLEVRRHRRRFAFRGSHLIPLPDRSPLHTHDDASHGFEQSERAGRIEALCRLVPGVLLPADVPDEGDRWRAVPVEGEETVPLVAASAAHDEHYRVIGFEPSSQEWALPAAPSFTTATEGVLGAFPELFAKVSADELQTAWREWAKPRNVPADAVNDSGVTLEGHRLLVRASPRLRAWVRAQRTDVLSHDAWLWVGGGSLRRGAVVTVRGE